MANTIQLKGAPIRKEGVASEAMSPGHFVVSTPTTTKGTGSLAFPAALGDVAQGVVYEDEIEGKGITDAYAVNDNVLYGVYSKGSEVLGRLPAGAAAVAVGTPLAVNTDGTLAPATIGTHYVACTAIEAVDNSGGGTEVFIQVEIA